MQRNLHRSAVPAVLILIAICAAWALPQSQSKQGASAQKKQAPAKDKDEAKPADQKPAEPPPPDETQQSSGLFKTKVLARSSSAQKGNASAGFGGVGPDGKVVTAVLTATPTAQDKQAALILSTLVMPDSEVDKFITEGKLNPPPPPAPAKGGK